MQAREWSAVLVCALLACAADTLPAQTASDPSETLSIVGDGKVHVVPGTIAENVFSVRLVDLHGPGAVARGFRTYFDPAQYSRQPWGTLTFQFTDCNHGRVDFTGQFAATAYGSGHMDLTRLTLPAGLTCE